MDAVIITVAHNKFIKMKQTDLDRLYGSGRKVLIDVKGLLDREEYEKSGYSYWRL